MTYTLRIATQETRDLVVTALRTAADQRVRVAKGAASKVAEAKRAGADVRSRAVKVTALLAEADELTTLAADLAAAEELPVFVPATYPHEVTVSRTDAGLAPLGTFPGEAPDDDGTSAAAQAIAELAGLTPSDPDAVEDPVTGALPEDAPTIVEEVLTP